MDDAEPSIELGIAGKLAAFLCFTAGISAIFAGGQVAAVVIFHTAWQGGLPWMQIGLGAAALFLAPQVAYPRRWALPAAALVLGGLVCGGVPWAVWLMYNGLFTALSVFAPGWATLAALLLAVATPSILSVGKRRAQVDADTARMTAEAVAAGYGYGRPERAGNPWLLPVIFGVLAVPVGAVVLAIGWPDRYDWLETRTFGLLHGRSPFAGFVEKPMEFPYERSPFERYVDAESRFRELDKLDVMAFVDEIADDVAWRLAAETGESDPVAAEAALWASGKQASLPLWIAASLRSHKVFYHVESLLSRSFNPELHVQPDAVHLDCDQLVYVFEHVAWRLDLAMRPVPSPMHVYLRYDGPAGSTPLYVEATQFADVALDGTSITGDEAHFFIDEDFHRSGRGGSYAAPSIVAAAGYYEPYRERDIVDEILANVIEGLAEGGETVDIAEAESRLEGTRSVTLVTNLYLRYNREAQSAFDAGDLVNARASATRARELRASHGDLVVYLDPTEERLLDTISRLEAPGTPPG